MKRGFYTIMAAQFFSSLADNALLIAAIALLIELKAPDWMTPMLKEFFYISYVLLAPFVGAFADSLPKGKVMFFTNLIKISGCFLMFLGIHPLAAYALVGLGAAAYSPAKYGILTELLPAEQLVVANGWIEGSTVGSIILGVVFGGALVAPHVSRLLLQIDFPFIETGVDTPAQAAICVIAVIYLIAALINLRIPLTNAVYVKQYHTLPKLLTDFGRCFMVLWRDPQGQISLAITTLFWGAGATLQFIVLEWARQKFHMPLSEATRLQGAVAIGVAVGAVLAASIIPLAKSFSVLITGVAMGVIVIIMTMVTSVPLAYALLILIGALSGFFVVPMNAMLQHRGHVLMSAGHSIAVQNFNENLSILAMLGLYALMVKMRLSIDVVIILFGAFVSLTMALVIKRHRMNLRNAAPSHA
jgi:MFS family permease